MTREMSNSPI
uniref:Uncharacterized protein n=1 Tax=Rhizophora mucronata TaxID=61149 RepID=A0A2P2PI16_RHIMU